MDFHKLVLIVLQSSIVENKPPKIQYRNHKYFDSGQFNRVLKEDFFCEYVDSCCKFDEIFLEVLNRHALLRRANHAPYVSKSKESYYEKIFKNVYFKKRQLLFQSMQKAKVLL